MFKDKLRELRESNDYSMDKLAELYNKKFNGKLNKSTISRYENGVQEPIYTVVRNFATLLELYDKLDTEDKAEIRGEMKQMLKADKYSDREKDTGLKHA